MSLSQDYSGRAEYSSTARFAGDRLFVAVACTVSGLEHRLEAMLDTGAQWCLLPSDLAARLGLDTSADPEQPRLHTRLGRLTGRLERLDLYLLADDGEDLRIDATFFITPEWPGPPVIGWVGCLERLRFALDPSREPGDFYFGALTP